MEKDKIETNEEAREAELQEHEEAAEAPADEAAQKIAALEEKIKEQEDRLLRLHAEYDNFRRRSREEREGAYDSAVADTFGALVPIIDNLARATQFTDGEKVKEGLAMTLKTVDAAMKSLHIETFGEAGDRFDPNLHSAVLHEEDPEKGEGEIVEVYQKGYKKGNKIIRFAMVKTVN